MLPGAPLPIREMLCNRSLQALVIINNLAYHRAVSIQFYRRRSSHSGPAFQINSHRCNRMDSVNFRHSKATFKLQASPCSPQVYNKASNRSKQVSLRFCSRNPQDLAIPTGLEATISHLSPQCRSNQALLRCCHRRQGLLILSLVSRNCNLSQQGVAQTWRKQVSHYYFSLFHMIESC